MKETNSSYRQIVRATSIFGGVQIFNILISIIKSKIVAIYLGPFGMGIFGLFISTIELLKSFTNFGLGINGVKIIAADNVSNDEKKLSTSVIILRRWIWFTGIFGTLLTIVLSNWLSKITFGNSNYTIGFIWLSLSVLFSQLTTGSLVILQGMRNLKYLAKANVIGNSMGLLIVIPLYYWFKVDAIIPVIILSSVFTFIFTKFFEFKIKFKNVSVSKQQTFEGGKKMLLMGYILSIGPLLAIGSSYVVRIYIGKYGGLADVGLYTAGFAIINTYVSLVFNAMLTDYFPRLSEVAHNNSLCKKIVNEQTEIALLILGPMLITFIVFINWIIVILYSKEFLPIKDMLYWAALSIFFKIFNWTIGIILIAKGETKVYFWSDLFANIYILILNVIGYYFGGLTGLGISFLIGYFLSFIQLYFINYIKFKFTLSPKLLTIFLVMFSLAICSFVVVKYFESPFSYIIGSVPLLISIIYAFHEMDKRIDIKGMIKSIVSKTK